MHYQYPFERKSSSWGCFGFILWATCGLGWVLNIIRLVQTIHGVVDGMMVLRIVGIPFAPLGVVLGLFCR